MSKQKNLDQIKADIVKQNICPNLAKTAKNMVFGHGDPDAEIVMIGEAPGRNEDETGLPFVGASGRVLDEMLASIGLDRSKTYITSILKYRPPNNRDPLPSEKEESLPFLLKQIEVIEPKLVVCLGRHSMEMFLPSAKISEAHGKLYEVKIGGKKLNIMPVYHPAAAIYSGKTKALLNEDFGQILKILKKLSKN